MGEHPALGARYDVCCVGNVVADLVVWPVPALPPPDTIHLLRGARLTPGGNGPNTAAAISRLGGRVLLCGAVGQDPLGEMLRARIRGAGVDDGGLRALPQGLTAVSVVLAREGGQHSFLHYEGANAALARGHVPWEAVARSRALHYASARLLPALDPHLPELMQRAKLLGCLTSLDLCWSPRPASDEAVLAALPWVDLLLANLEEGRQLTGLPDALQIARHLREQGAGTVVVKLGAQGCLVVGREEFSSSAPEVGVVDTTGAGDCFAAALLLAVLRGYALPEAAKLANAVAAVSTTQPGGFGVAPSWDIALEMAAQIS